MRILIFVAGVVTIILGFIAHGGPKDISQLQGALTLGGGWIICGFFTYHSMWHGIIGAGVLGLLAAARCAPALGAIGSNRETTLQAIVFVISIVIVISTVKMLTNERARRQVEELKNSEEES